jgi:hypothetical protein
MAGRCHVVVANQNGSEVSSAVKLRVTGTTPANPCTICNGCPWTCALALGRAAGSGHGGRAMIICAAGDIHGAHDRLFEDVLAFEEALGVRFEWVLHVGDFGVWP